MDKINLHFTVEGSGKPLVFIHGLSDSLLYWELLASNLKNEYQIIRMDLRGHGESELGNDEITIDLYVNDIVNILDNLDVNDINLIGFSLGGIIALDFALKYPDRVSSLVLMSTFAKIEDQFTDIYVELKKALNIGFEEFYDMILPMVLCPKVIEENHDELEFLKQLASQTANTQAYIKAIDACLDFDVKNRLSEIEIPALILAGKYDEMAPVDIQKDIHANIAGSELIILDDVKHNLLVGQNNMKILDILKKFLKNKK